MDSDSQPASVKEQDEVADLPSKVEALKVSGDRVQKGDRAPRGEKRNTPRRDKESNPESVTEGAGDDDVFREPRVRNDHDNRFNFPNRTFSRENSRGRGRDNDDWGRGGGGGGRGRGRYDDREFSRDGNSRGRYAFFFIICDLSFLLCIFERLNELTLTELK